jgi:uncharacterized MAPEG superfamily protein
MAMSQPAYCVVSVMNAYYGNLMEYAITGRIAYYGKYVMYAILYVVGWCSDGVLHWFAS